MPGFNGITIQSFDKNNLRLEKEIGRGSFGKVYIGSFINTDLPQLAIKVFFSEIRNRGNVLHADKEKVYEELLKLAVVDHENIVKLYGMIEDYQHDLPCLVFEYMKDGNFLDYVRKTVDVKELQKTLVGFCRDICSGMVFLHSHQILHKDLAARNILLSGKTAKISDLGLSAFLTNDDGGVYALNGKLFPYRHAAVECIVEQLYTFESDVWSFGILMYEMFTLGMTPYGREFKEAEVRRFIVDLITPLDINQPQCSPKILSLMQTILNPVLPERPTFLELHSAFEKMLNVGKPKQLKSPQNEDNIASALSTFHQMKTEGLSSSFNNLHIISSSPNTISSSTSGGMSLLSHPNGALLSVNSNMPTTRSSSTPDILNEVESVSEEEEKTVHYLQPPLLAKTSKLPLPRARPKETLRFHQPSNFHRNGDRLEVQLQERRHSEDLLRRVPLRSENNVRQNEIKFQQHLRLSQSNLPSPNTEDFSELHTMNNNSPLLEGFVQNRFGRRKF